MMNAFPFPFALLYASVYRGRNCRSMPSKGLPGFFSRVFRIALH